MSLRIDAYDVERVEQGSFRDVDYTRLEINMSRHWERGHIFGIDPGQRNMGFTKLEQDSLAVVWQLHLPQINDPVHRMHFVRSLISWLAPRHNPDTCVVVEGASFGSVHGQVPLAEVRAACVFAFQRAKVRIVPPSTIRKEVFGSGRRKAADVWPKLAVLYPDAVASLGCALYSVYAKE